MEGKKIPEVTENYIHIPILDIGRFVKTSFKTITISSSKGIKALIGKFKTDPKGSTHIYKYLFVKTKWAMNTAKAWIKKHKEGLALISVIDEYGIISTAAQKMDKEIEEMVQSCPIEGEEEEHLAFYSPINIDQKGPKLIISGIALAEGKFRRVFYPYEEIKKSIKRLRRKDYIVEHGLNLKWKDKVVGKVFKVEASDILRAALYKAEITDKEMMEEILKGKWKGNSVRVLFDECSDPIHKIRAVNLDYENISLTDTPACRSCIIIQKELKAKLHELSLDGGTTIMESETITTPSPETDNTQEPEELVETENSDLSTEDNSLIEQINDMLKAEGSEEDKLKSITSVIEEHQLGQMDTPDMFRAMLSKLDNIESRLQNVETTEGGETPNTEEHSEGSSGCGGEGLGDGEGEEGGSETTQTEEPTVDKDKDKEKDKDKDPKTTEEPTDDTTTEGSTTEPPTTEEPTEPTEPSTTEEPTTPPTTQPTEPTPPVEPTVEEPIDLTKYRASALLVKAYRPETKLIERSPLWKEEEEE